MLKCRTSLKTMIITVCLLLSCGGMLTSCGNKADKNGSMISDDGRSYGGFIIGDVGDTIETAFFDMTVNEAFRYNTYQFNDGLYEAEDGNTYLVVNITIKNTYDADIPISITDFTLDFEGNKSKDILTGYGKADLNQDSFMENIFTLKKGEKITKSILFTVKNKKNYTLNYEEYYEDEFKGDEFSIQLTPAMISADDGGNATEKKEQVKDDEKTSASKKAEENESEE